MFSLLNLQSLLGLVVIVAVCWAISENRKAFPWRLALGAIGVQAALILALIAVYRISDVVMGIMANPFYVDMGYTKDEVAAVTKVFGVFMTLAGAFVGGVLSMRVGVMRVLMLGALLSGCASLDYYTQLGRGQLDLLAVAVRDGAVLVVDDLHRLGGPALGAVGCRLDIDGPVVGEREFRRIARGEGLLDGLVELGETGGVILLDVVVDVLAESHL